MEGPVVGGMVVDGTVEGGTVIGGVFVRVGGNVEGVGVGGMIMVMMIGGGGSTPCIWRGKKEDRRVGQGRENRETGDEGEG